jgi:hypothetical protein
MKTVLLRDDNTRACRYNWDDVFNLMDEDICNELAILIAPCSPQRFLDAYLDKHLEKFNEEFTVN